MFTHRKVVKSRTCSVGREEVKEQNQYISPFSTLFCYTKQNLRPIIVAINSFALISVLILIFIFSISSENLQKYSL